jgi:hypothetical protein
MLTDTFVIKMAVIADFFSEKGDRGWIGAHTSQA